MERCLEMLKYETPVSLGSGIIWYTSVCYFPEQLLNLNSVGFLFGFHYIEQID